MERDETNTHTDRPSRRCSATTRAGKPCPAWALRTGDKCAGHSQLGLAADPAAASARSQRAREAARKREHERRRRQGMTLQEAGQEALHEHRDAVIQALFAPILAEETAPRARQEAALRVWERFYGTPLQRAETETHTRPVSLADMLAALDSPTMDTSSTAAEAAIPHEHRDEPRSTDRVATRV